MQSIIQRRGRGSGFSLIEVLVALLVLSFCLLGMIGLQATALQNNREARLQSVAINLARELAEMMRGNKDVAMRTDANPYVGDFSATVSATGQTPASPASPSSCLSTGSSCSDTTAVANAELTDWLARVSNSLPGARVTICPDSAPYSAAGLPQWTCTANADADAHADVIVVKIGWTHLSTDASIQDRNVRTSSTSAENLPRVILPITAGSTTS